MQPRICVGAVAFVLAGCAGPILNQYTEYLGPTVGSLEDRQILNNLGRFVDNPWAIPGHVELANGQIQATNMLGINLKYPFSRAISPAGLATTTVGSEVDVNPAQTQDQESYNLLPVTDTDDLRRLRAIYHYAVCPDPSVFAAEWQVADQYIYARPPAPKPPPAGKGTSSKDFIHKLVQDYIDEKSTADTPEKVESSIEAKFSTMPLLDADKKKRIKETLEQTRGRAPKMTADQATDAIVKILGPEAVAAAAPAGAKAGGVAKDTSTGNDTIAFEQQRGKFIISPYGLGTSRWLYWRDAAGQISGSCPGTGSPLEYPPDPARLVSLGSARGHEFFTDDPKRFSDLILFVLGGIPNTTGAHVLDSGAGGLGLPPKAGRTQFFTIGGQPGATVPSKPY